MHRVERDRRVGRGRSPGPAASRSRSSPAGSPRCHVRPASVETAVPMFDGGAVLAPSDLERGDDGRSRRRAVRLDRGLVLAVAVRVRVDREPPRHDLAVRRDAVGRVGADDVEPAPQSTRSVPPNATWTRSAPRPGRTRSAAGVPTIRSPRFEPWIVAAVAVEASARSRRTRAGTAAHGRARPEYPRRVRVHDVDVLVVGSGFGGSVAALRLTEKGYRVAVLEAGRRFEPEDFARTNWNLRRYLFMPRLGLRGIQRLTVLDDLRRPLGRGSGRRLARVRERARRAARAVLRRSAMGGHRRLARRAGAVLRRACAGCSARPRRRSRRRPT